MIYFALAILLFVVLPLPIAGLINLWLRGRRALVGLLAVIGVAVMLGLSFVFFYVPEPAEIIEEWVTISMLKHHANEDSLQNWFRLTWADWHLGRAWTPGVYYGAPPNACTSDCEALMQVAYTNFEGMCFVAGERITMHFDKHRNLKTWSVEAANDGC